MPNASHVHPASLSSRIRAASRSDVGALKAVIDATGLFPSEMLDDMLEPYLAGGAVEDIWLVVDDGSDAQPPLGLAYCASERMTSGTWNLYLIAVHPSHQRKGFGGALVATLEAMLAARGERILLVETSGLPEFERPRAFYANHGYEEEARIREFYRAGEDKIVFRKALAPVA